MKINNKKNFGYIRRGIVPLLIILLSGCSTLSTHERTYTSDGKQIVARDNNIEVHVLKKQNYWDIFYVNNSTEPKCVATTWEFFDLTNKVPRHYIYIDSNSVVFIGYFKERTWNFDGLGISIGGSGHIDKFRVINPYKKRKDCKFPKSY